MERRDLTYRSSSLLLSICVSTISTSPIILSIFIFSFVKQARVLKYCIYSYPNRHRGARLSNFLRVKCGVYSRVAFIRKLDATKKCSQSILIISKPRRLFNFFPEYDAYLSKYGNSMMQLQSKKALLPFLSRSSTYSLSPGYI